MISIKCSSERATNGYGLEHRVFGGYENPYEGLFKRDGLYINALSREFSMVEITSNIGGSYESTLDFANTFGDPHGIVEFCNKWGSLFPLPSVNIEVWILPKICFFFRCLELVSEQQFSKVASILSEHAPTAGVLGFSRSMSGPKNESGRVLLEANDLQNFLHLEMQMIVFERRLVRRCKGCGKFAIPKTRHKDWQTCSGACRKRLNRQKWATDGPRI